MKNCENCAREVCRFMPPVGEVNCGYWKPDKSISGNWIPCSERIPEVYKNVLIYYARWEDNPIQVAHIQGDGLCWEFSDGEFYPAMKDVTHWMPLPNPPVG